MTSCSKEKINLLSDNQDTLPSAELIDQLAKVDKSTIPTKVKIPELTEENMATIPTKSTECIQYGAWNYTTELGWVWPFDSNDNWFWSYKYKDYIWIFSHDDICDGGGIQFYPNHDICGHGSNLWDNNAAENTLWQYQNGAWTTVSCGVCDNNDYSSRFLDLIEEYSYLEGAAASSGATNYVNNLFAFRDLVQTGAPLDIKNTDDFLSNLGSNGCGVKLFGRNVAVDVPGNIMYGFIGHLYWKNKYADDTALFLGAASGLAQSISDGNGGTFAPALLLDPSDWLWLTSGDPWCDTYAIYFGVDLAMDYGANITYDELVPEVNSTNTWLNDPNFNCPAPYSPTGWCEDGSYGPC